MSEINPQEHHSPIQTPKQLIAVVVLAFVVPIAVIVLLTQLFALGMKVDRSSAAMSPESVAERLRPVGQVMLAEAGRGAQASASATPAASAGVPSSGAGATRVGATAKAAAAGAADGKAIYEKTCAACHMTGAANAPKAGDKAAWEPRLKGGIDVLREHAIKGKGAMPPKGGNASLSDAEVKAAVDYLVGLAK